MARAAHVLMAWMLLIGAVELSVIGLFSFLRWHRRRTPKAWIGERTATMEPIDALLGGGELNDVTSPFRDDLGDWIQRRPSMKTRCKFYVSRVAKYGYQNMPTVGPQQEEVTLNAVYGSVGENQSFSAATPNGTMTIMVTNPAVLGTFALGSEYYIDLIPVEANDLTPR